MAVLGGRPVGAAVAVRRLGRWLCGPAAPFGFESDRLDNPNSAPKLLARNLVALRPVAELSRGRVIARDPRWHGAWDERGSSADASGGVHQPELELVVDPRDGQAFAVWNLAVLL